MRFCVFGQGEGVSSDSEQRVWASVESHVVVDASVSARKRGVKPGMTKAAATALISDLILYAKEPQPTRVMKGVWNTLCSYTPWLETLGEDSFWIQLPGDSPSFQETRNLLEKLNGQIGDERRFRVGTAENPFLARALVLWSRVERVSDALYRRVGGQQWLISPGLAKATSNSDGQSRNGIPWIRRMPIRALWMLPHGTRDALLRFGVDRLQDLASVPESELVRHFGKEAWLWSRFLEQEPGGQLQVNYPPLHYREVWGAPIDESIPVEALGEILAVIVQPISSALERSGLGALKIGLRWTTDHGQGTIVKNSKRPLVQPMSLMAQLRPALKECHGRCLERLEVFVEDLRPLTAVQTSFVIYKGMLLASRSIERDEIHKVLHHVNHKYPRSLTLGIRPRFRELRLQAIAEPTAFVQPMRMNRDASHGR